MKILDNKLLNLSEIARLIGMNNSLFWRKVKKAWYHKLTDEQEDKVVLILKDFSNDLTRELNDC